MMYSIWSVVLIICAEQITFSTTQGITVTGQTTVCKLGKTFHLTCLYENPGKLLVTYILWKDSTGDEIFNFIVGVGGVALGWLKNRNTSYDHTSSHTTLCVGNATESDEGNYTCTINAGGEYGPATVTLLLYEDANTSVILTPPPTQDGIFRATEHQPFIINASTECARPGIRLWWSREESTATEDVCDLNNKKQRSSAIFYVERFEENLEGPLQLLASHPSFESYPNNTRLLGNFTIQLDRSNTSVSVTGIPREDGSTVGLPQ